MALHGESLTALDRAAKVLSWQFIVIIVGALLGAVATALRHQDMQYGIGLIGGMLISLIGRAARLKPRVSH